MALDQIGALASIVGTFVLLVGSIAAIVQLKHLRLTYQLETYLNLMSQLFDPTMVAAREYLDGIDFHDPQTLERALTEGIDHRVLMYVGYFQVVARLLTHHIVDRDLFGPITMIAPSVWQKIRPLAYAWRKQHPSNPRWADLEYLVYNGRGKRPFNLRWYSASFRKQAALDASFDAWQDEAEAALAAE